MGKNLYVIINKQTNVVEIYQEKAQIARLLGVNYKTVTNNFKKGDYEKGIYRVCEVIGGAKKSKRGGKFLKKRPKGINSHTNEVTNSEYGDWYEH